MTKQKREPYYRYLCPVCGAGGAHPQSSPPPICHLCAGRRVTMRRDNDVVVAVPTQEDRIRIDAALKQLWAAFDDWTEQEKMLARMAWWHSEQAGAGAQVTIPPDLCKRIEQALQAGLGHTRQSARMARPWPGAAEYSTQAQEIERVLTEVRALDVDAPSGNRTYYGELEPGQVKPDAKTFAEVRTLSLKTYVPDPAAQAAATALLADVEADDHAACDPACRGDDSESHCVRTNGPYCGVTNPNLAADVGVDAAGITDGPRMLGPLLDGVAPSVEPEPVAWMHVQGNHFEPSLRELDDEEKARGWTQFPLYGAAGVTTCDGDKQ